MFNKSPPLMIGWTFHTSGQCFYSLEKKKEKSSSKNNSRVLEGPFLGKTC